LDGEPSYEHIPQGLHDTLQPRWDPGDVRRYAYWSVFAGSFGHTYGHNSVMQFYSSKDNHSSYGANIFWEPALDAEGASQMCYLKDLILSRQYFDRIPDSNLVAIQGEKYNYLSATRGKDYAFIYTYTGRTINVQMGLIEGEKIAASWYSPRNGEKIEIGIFENKAVKQFNPPGEVADGNDWVLILDTYKI
jgi:hypothetical protein